MLQGLARLEMTLQVLWLALAALACGDDGSTLFVDVRSDFEPGREVDTIQVELAAAADTSTLRTNSEAINAMHDLFGGVRAADFGGLAPSDYVVRVSLLASGALVARTSAAAEVAGNTALTVVVSRTCAGISCPTLTDAPTETSCVGGRCATPQCAAGTGTGCDPPACTNEGDCSGAPACASARCTSGVCLYPRDGCMDGGVAPDGGDVPCTFDMHCVDGDACNGDESCVGGVCRAGTPVTCTEVPCRTSVCVAGICEYTPVPNGTPCGALGSSCCASGCTNLDTDEMNCGGCGSTCTPGFSCLGGTCG